MQVDVEPVGGQRGGQAAAEGVLGAQRAGAEGDGVTEDEEPEGSGGHGAAASDAPSLPQPDVHGAAVVGARGQRPRHTGARRSANAVAPSRASSDANTGRTISSCRAHASSGAQDGADRTISFVAATASGPLAAIVVGQLDGRRPAPPPSSTTRLTRPTAARPLGVDRLAGQQQLQGDGPRHPLRQQQSGSAGGDQRPLHLGDAEPRRPPGDDEVAREHQLEPAGQGPALDGGDQRLARRRDGDAAQPAALDGRASPRAGTP